MLPLKCGSLYYCVWNIFLLLEDFANVWALSKSMNKEGREAVPKFCIMAESIFSEKSDSLGVCMVQLFHQIE